MHTPSNVNQQHRDSMGLNDRIALFIVKRVSTMWCAYFFAILALIGLKNVNSVTSMIQWASQTFIQLVMLSILALAGNLDSRHAELRAEEHYRGDMAMHEELLAMKLRQETILKNQRTIIAALLAIPGVIAKSDLNS